MTYVEKEADAARRRLLFFCYVAKHNEQPLILREAAFRYGPCEATFAESSKMKHLIFAAAAGLIGSTTVALAHTAAQAPEAGVIIADGKHASEVAMGPTSAPHKPSGTGPVDEQQGAPDQPHEKARDRHRHRFHSRD
jgi:hypothetical protein